MSIKNLPSFSPLKHVSYPKVNFDNYLPFKCEFGRLRSQTFRTLVSHTKISIFPHVTQGFVCLFVCLFFLVVGFLIYEYHQDFPAFFVWLPLSSQLCPPETKISKVFSAVKYYWKLFVHAYVISHSLGIYLQERLEKKKSHHLLP